MKLRKSNFDILKIIAILGIILHHYALWSNWKFENGLHLNKVATNTLLIGGKLGVNLFIMITGFFMIYSKPKIKSILKIWIDTTIVSIVVYLFLIFFHTENLSFSWSFFLMRLLPIVFDQYWFITSYSLLYFSIPFLNKLVLVMNKKMKKRLFIILFIVLSIWPFLYYREGMNFSFPIWFMFLYLIGAFVRIDEEKVKKYSTKRISICLLCTLFSLIVINISLIVILNNSNNKLFEIINFLDWNENIFYIRDCSPLLLVMAICIFVLFLKLDIKYKKIYTIFSKGALGAYLFQSAPWFNTKVLWPVIINANRFTSSKVILVYGLVSVVILYLVGVFLYYVLQPMSNFLLNLLWRSKK